MLEGGWYRTGDLGYIDAKGFLVVKDWLKDTIKYNGFQVSPVELEEILVRHSDVEEVAVCGIWSEEASSDLVRAYVVPRKGVEVSAGTAKSITEFLKGKVSRLSSFTHERLWVGITALRLSRVALEDSYRYALRRETFGKKLFENQAIRLKFSRMSGLIESVHHLMEDLVRHSALVSALEFSPWAALLKMQAAHNLETISREAQQIFGGLSYSRVGAGGRVEQISRDVRVLVVSGGSEEILQDMIAKQQKKLARL
ncbi:uncharacterized protein BKA55DRAFT_686170 [Fusarium redolens]|uniref:Acyl-CoA dehydrogenase/oxidase C-terminal domain-containing protein n=1 Tax=Fusarium redolens TaxID=48865 RepID=A0A9P9HZG1_FUSRE|nr:uncharacterized protein BKA55DRAFT_686170 [Fusarium redolens]KAH7265702.1 hypothetical protein BKA55DRAFT_686170 [Fusarium redolens]